MEKIYLSDAGPKVSPAVYGFYRWNEVANAADEMERIVRLCLDLGINTFDHADIYGSYQCEELFGNVIRKMGVRREELVLFTKCGLRITHPSEPGVRVRHYDLSRGHLLESVDRSLQRLKTDYIDIFLLNHFDPIANLEETAYTLHELKDKGKVKNVGIVNFTVFQHQLLSAYLRIPIVTHHLELNLLNTTALDNGQIDFSKQNYMRPLASSPLAAGQIAKTDYLPLAVRRSLEEMSRKYACDNESIAVAWLLKLGALPLIGTTSEQRIRNIVRAFEINLDHQDWYELYAASRSRDF
jgi:predicted oxidoreductase